jgi:hypothetical protein
MPSPRLILLLILSACTYLCAAQNGNNIPLPPVQPVADAAKATIRQPDSILKNSINNITSTVTDRFNGIDNIDSLLDAQFETISAKVISKIKHIAASSLANIRKNRLSLPKMPKLDPQLLASLKKFNVADAAFTSSASGWETAGTSNIFWQSELVLNVSASGIPVRAEAQSSWNFYNVGHDQRFTYRLNYNKNDFLNKLGINKNELKKQVAAASDFNQVLNYNAIVKDAFAEVKTMGSIVNVTGCNWNHLLNMPMGEFKKNYNKDVLKSKIAEAEQLKKYYAGYVKTTKDSIVAAKMNAADSQLTTLKQQSALYEKLMRIKTKAEALKAKIEQLKRTYDEKMKTLVEGYNVVNDVIKNNKDLNGLQKFFLKVKGLNIGQHTLSTGNLVLQNYLQNGVSFEYETDKLYVLLTKGSQKQLLYPGNFYQNTVNTQPGVNEYYQFNSKYNLSGFSLGRGNRARNYQQLSVMNFTKLNNPSTPSLVARTVNVITFSNQLVSNGGKKLSYDLSKSIVKQQANANGRSDRVPAGNFLESMALQVKFDNTNRVTQERQKLTFIYSNLSYTNPGLNGGISRPGLQLTHGFDKKITERIKIGNQFAYYAFKYGNSVSLKSLREKIDVSYKLKKMRVGLMLNGIYGNQLQYDPKVTYKNQAIDLLATTQAHKRFGLFHFNFNGGLGYGYNQQENFNKVKDYSFYGSLSTRFRNFSLDIDLDKFNTRNTEVFLSDSTALFLVSSFNFQSAFAYMSEKGNMVQAGVQYKKLNDAREQFFVTASVEWQFGKRILLAGNLNLPLSSPTTGFFVNNIFNSRFIYNIKKHDK